MTASREYTEVDHGIKTCMYAGYPDLYMQFSNKNDFIFMPDWYRGIEYPKEQERGYASNEDLYVPGYFEMPIKKGESIVFAASTSQTKATGLKKLFDDEVALRAPRDNFYHILVTAAHQFHNRQKNDDRYLLAGYPWFKARARDTFIALPGLTLAIDERDYFELVMKTAEKGLREFMEEKPLSVKIYEIEQPDVPLWAIWSVQQYVKFVGKDEGYRLYGKLVEDIVDYVIADGHPNLRLDENGLVYSNGRDKAVTWMNSTANGRPVVPRSGYIVEFNALWYNALKFCAAMLAEQGNQEKADALEQRAALAKQSFVETFVNAYGYLLDYVDGTNMDWSVRPNMIFAVGRGTRLLAALAAADEERGRYMYPRTADTEGPALAVAEERRLQPDVRRPADTARLCLPSGYGVALARRLLYGGLPETLQALTPVVHRASDGGLRRRD